MFPHDADELGTLLEQALDLPPESRGPFLDAASRGDPALREALASLLVAHDAESGYFERLRDQIVVPALQTFTRATDDELEPGQVVAHYELLEPLGHGGMGVVFKAFDRRLQRFVALKFLPPHLKTNVKAKARLVAEAQAASALDHPNIGVVHDIGETGAGRLFLVMRWYDGETLDKARARSSRDVFAVVLQIASALAAAHQKGITHRDVKPSNILVTSDGGVKLLDFGIAKLAHSTLVRDASTPGTVAYMSPEQTRGEEVDHRTDLWSLGVVLYELLTGTRPFRGGSDDALVDAIRHQPWEPVDRLNPEVPVETNRIIGRCLAKNANERYESAQALLDDVNAIAACIPAAPPTRRFRGRLAAYVGAAALVSLLAGGGLLWQRKSPAHSNDAPSGAGRVAKVAVLPMLLLGDDSDDSYLADGITSDVAGRLSRQAGLRVIARSSSMPYAGSGKNPIEIGRELGASMVLDGEVLRGAGKINVTARLSDARTGKELWSETFVTNEAGLQVVPQQITKRVSEILRGPAVAQETRQLDVAGTSSADAYLAYLRGRHLLAKWDAPSAKRAKEFFERALDLDPAYAQAWTGLGDTYHVLGGLAVVPASDAYPRTRAAAERALQLDPDLSEGHVSLATALSAYYWEFEAAAQHIRRAIDLNPSDATAHNLYSEHLRYQGRFDEALVEARLAEELDPLAPVHQLDAGIVLYLARRYDEAIAQFRRLLAMKPDHAYAYFPLALSYVQSRRYEEALDALDRAGSGGRLQVQQHTLRGYIHARTGRHNLAAQELERLERLSSQIHVSPWHFAVVHLGLQNYERSLDLLEQAYGERTWQLRLLSVEPMFDPLRSDHRFRALIAKVR